MLLFGFKRGMPFPEELAGSGFKCENELARSTLQSPQD
jgi:hypothetical protein